MVETPEHRHGRPHPPRARAGRRLRVKKSAEVRRVFDAGRRVADKRLTLVAAPRADGPGRPSRLAVAVSKKHGNAVRRNRVKRLCREAFRLSRGDLPGGLDFVMIPRAGRAHDLGDLRASLRALARRFAGRGRAP